jgi:uncharacterized membrane protein YdjX (TVP38/TMEM64 family)
MPIKKLLLALFIAAMIILYLAGGGEKYLDIHMYQDLYAASPLSTAAVFFLVFMIGTAFSLPVTAVMAISGGIVFGTLTGCVISLLSSTLGGTIALYSSRYLFHDLVSRRFAPQLDMVNKGVANEGAFFLFGLRMIPVIPFWGLNLLMGLTTMKVPVFMTATLLGMVPVMLILSYTGNELGEIESFSVAEVFTPGLILAMCLLASFPILARLLVRLLRARRKAGNG